MYVLCSHDANFANDVTLFPGILRSSPSRKVRFPVKLIITFCSAHALHLRCKCRKLPTTYPAITNFLYYYQSDLIADEISFLLSTAGIRRFFFPAGMMNVRIETATSRIVLQEDCWRLQETFFAKPLLNSYRICIMRYDFASPAGYIDNRVCRANLKNHE